MPFHCELIFCFVKKENQNSRGGNIHSPSLLLQLFDLRETLIRKKIIKFHAQGMCMYPCVRPGDCLHIEYKKPEAMAIGDIAVYRRGNNLFGHRVIEKGYQDNCGYILTRPDTVSKGSDGPIFNQDIVGVVINIERKKRLLGPQKIQCGLTDRAYLKLARVFFKLKAFSRNRIGRT
jgi:hypothetical protein